ncbi:MAG: nuclear transport factor 2 family protein [Myxococcota bacterium]|nr:nuclear transport factor 2 family protein [Myxococcales bacterium]
MATEANREAALRFIQSMARGVLDEALLAPDATWWVPGTGTLDKAGFQHLVTAFHEACTGPVTMTVDGVTAEGDRVAVEAHSEAELVNGASYRNTYHFLFEFEQGRIVHVKEYNDSLHAAETVAMLLPQ